MGKNTDKLFITHSEWAQGDGHSASGGVSVQRDLSLAKAASALPFWTCSISQQPIQEDSGMADTEGYVFDVRNILPYIRKHSKNPVTGKPMATSDLTKLHIAKNSEGQYIDPISFKEFQRLSEPVMIKPSGRVYFESTIKEHNIKSKFWKDLVSDEPFKKADIIKLKGGAGVLNGNQPSSEELISLPFKKVKAGPVDKSVKSMQTTHHMASSVTSTAVEPSTQAQFTDIPIDKLLRQKKFLEPGYAVIETDFGSLNVELFPKYSPKAVYNFVQLAKEGYYNGLIFHRNIKHFMIQTGDPTGTGRGGRSAFPGGAPFADETNTPLKHTERGILAMANKGKMTNTSQFFITYRRAPHLDGKHTVFAKVVGGISVLDDLEKIPSGPDDVPIKKVYMRSVKILVDPFEKGLYDKDQNQTEKEVDATAKDQEDDGPWLKRKAEENITVGGFIDLEQHEPQVSNRSAEIDDLQARKKRVKTSISNSSFAGW